VLIGRDFGDSSGLRMDAGWVLVAASPRRRVECVHIFLVAFEIKKKLIIYSTDTMERTGALSVCHKMRLLKNSTGSWKCFDN